MSSASSAVPPVDFVYRGMRSEMRASGVVVIIRYAEGGGKVDGSGFIIPLGQTTRQREVSTYRGNKFNVCVSVEDPDTLTAMFYRGGDMFEYDQSVIGFKSEKWDESP